MRNDAWAVHGLARPNEAAPFTVDGLSVGAIGALAHHLRRAVAGARGPVCLLAEDRNVVAATVLASLAGGPEIVLPHALSARALVDLAEHLQFDTVIADSARRGLSERADVNVICPRLAPGATQSLPAPIRDPHAPFLSLFTGGSTGRPQKWSKTPANLLGEARYLTEHFEIDPNDRIVTTVPPIHIYGLLFTVLVPLAAGASVHNESLFCPQEIVSALNPSGPTVLVSTPAHYKALGKVLRADSSLSHRLRLALSSGAPLDPDDAEAFSRPTGLGVTEIYGSTETGGVATRCRAQGDASWRALNTARWEIVDGHLAVDSPFLSPELPRDAASWFKTADRARAVPSGRFELLGRSDGIVKVGAKRVDLAEVEQKLISIAGVSQAFVFSREIGLGRGLEIAALYVGDRVEADVRRELIDRLEPAAMPRGLRRVQEIPLTATGKRSWVAAERLLSRRA